MTTEFNADDFVEIYETDSATDAERIANLVLRAQGIDAVVHNRMSQSLPAPAAEPGECTIAVPKQEREQAEALLKEYLDGLAEGVKEPAK